MERTKKRSLNLLILLISITAIILGLGAYGYYKVLSTNQIYEGVSVDEFDLSFKTKEEALNFIRSSKEKELDEKNMVLSYEDKVYDINIREFDFKYNYDDAVNKAYSIGRKGNIINRITDIIDTKKNGVNISLNSSYDKNKINEFAGRIAQEIDLEMKEAEFHFNNGNITITDEVIGKKVKQEELIQLIENNIYDLNPIEIPVEIIKPTRTRELLSRINGVIAEYFTSFKGSKKERIENIKISAQALSKKIIMPGEIFSFNEVVGPRKKEFGYKEANIIKKGEFIPDVGGGVCQTSTTLYNALLLADVEIIERSPHSVPVKYVNLGQDAAVSYGFLDLKFRNNFDFPLFIHSRIMGDRLHIYIYGDKASKNYSIKIEPKVVETIEPKEEIVEDSALEPGTKELVQEGRKGYKVHTYKHIIKNGKIVETKLISRDFYKPRNYIYKTGRGSHEQEITIDEKE
ncbi:vancomycin resistance protein YoaR [Keratinibaculum paraultunense]|uniref:Vancomycin resistance protein YoaR n=1 Tax=Keratinibaculum paraultunense TaxID=1278232 RepID=A0A4R3L031_9FIRM|nr:VanW family protein [Keratinibaculum paraultunense]QQY80256.1 VanW family protein [Keratinibaculum paraultunense]TCS90769.1 vancomycin resistance protein YoaR [Keratinibaculum paraultunense]